MFLIQQVLSDPLQQQNLILQDGSTLSLTIYFRSMQTGWFINNLTYQTFTINGLRIVNSPNMLYQWKNLIPFGLACFSVGNREPSLAQDFSSGNSKLYILSQAEVSEYTEFLQNG